MFLRFINLSPYMLHSVLLILCSLRFVTRWISIKVLEKFLIKFLINRRLVYLVCYGKVLVFYNLLILLHTC